MVRLYKNLLLFLIVFISLPLLKAVDFGSSHDALNLKDLARYDVIVEGEFILDSPLPGMSKSITTSIGQKFEGMSYLVPFKIEKSSTKDIGTRINIDLFYPTNQAYFSDWSMPLKERLFLFLKKDPNNNTYYLLNPHTDWLVITGQFYNIEGDDINNKVLDEITEFLNSRKSDPEKKIEFPYAPYASDGVVYTQGDPSVIRAMRAGSSMASSNEEFLAVLEKYSHEPGETGQVAREIIISIGNYEDALRRLKDYNHGKSSEPDKLNFPFELMQAISAAKNPNDLMPLISEALASPDSNMRLDVLDSLIKKKAKGNQFYSLFLKLLDDPDREVQQAAMACIFYMSGSDRIYYPKQEIHLPTYEIFQKNPDLYIQQYKAWWEKHKDTLK